MKIDAINLFYNSGNLGYAAVAALATPINNKSVKSAEIRESEDREAKVQPVSATYYPGLESFVGQFLNLQT